VRSKQGPDVYQKIRPISDAARATVTGLVRRYVTDTTEAHEVLQMLGCVDSDHHAARAAAQANEAPVTAERRTEVIDHIRSLQRAGVTNSAICEAVDAHLQLVTNILRPPGTHTTKISARLADRILALTRADFIDEEKLAGMPGTVDALTKIERLELVARYEAEGMSVPDMAVMLVCEPTIVVKYLRQVMAA